MRFNHIGIFVNKIDLGLIELQKIIKIKKKSSLIKDKNLKVKVMFIVDRDNICYELVAPYGKNNPISKTLEKKVNILNHLAYETKNFSNNINKLIRLGYRPITKPAKAKAFKGKKIIFLINKLNFIIELIESN
tara:strand:- start:30 stop:428 length:399 start_codon:yes stop_codon:yes gene_type:complete